MEAWDGEGMGGRMCMYRTRFSVQAVVCIWVFSVFNWCIFVPDLL